jgi:opacity protein-like surface antigen
MFKTFLLLLVSYSVVLAQPVGFGLKLGVPVNNAFSGPSSGDGRFTIGPEVDLRLPFGLGVEADLLYNRYNFSSENLAVTANRSNSNSWEIPILLKYKLSQFGPVHPFVSGGFSFRTFQSVLRFNPKQINDANGTGFVLGAGVSLKLLLIRVSPEIRYTHWGIQKFQDASNILFQAGQNEGQFLVGFTF